MVDRECPSFLAASGPCAARPSVRTRASRSHRTDVVYPVVDSPAAGGLTGLDRLITLLADSPRCMAEMICTGVVAAIGEICALNTGFRRPYRVWLNWVRHRFPRSHDLCRALSMTPSAPRLTDEQELCSAALGLHRCGAPRVAPRPRQGHRPGARRARGQGPERLVIWPACGPPGGVWHQAAFEIQRLPVRAGDGALFQDIESGRRESNPHDQLGRLRVWRY